MNSHIFLLQYVFILYFDLISTTVMVEAMVKSIVTAIVNVRKNCGDKNVVNWRSIFH